MLTWQSHAPFSKSLKSLKVCAPCQRRELCGGARRVSVRLGGKWQLQRRPATLPVLPRPAPRTLLWLGQLLASLLRGCCGGVGGLFGGAQGAWHVGWQPTAPDTTLSLLPSCTAHSGCLRSATCKPRCTCVCVGECVCVRTQCAHVQSVCLSVRRERHSEVQRDGFQRGAARTLVRNFRSAQCHLCHRAASHCDFDSRATCWRSAYHRPRHSADSHFLCRAGQRTQRSEVEDSETSLPVPSAVWVEPDDGSYSFDYSWHEQARWDDILFLIPVRRLVHHFLPQKPRQQVLRRSTRGPFNNCVA